MVVHNHNKFFPCVLQNEGKRRRWNPILSNTCSKFIKHFQEKGWCRSIAKQRLRACGLKQGCPSAFAGETCGSFFKEANRSVKSFTPYFGYTFLWNICDSDSKNAWNTPHLQQPPLNPFFAAMVAAVGCQSSLKRPHILCMATTSLRL